LTAVVRSRTVALYARRGTRTLSNVILERIRIDLEAQRLDLLRSDRVVASYPVSTAANGAGERAASEQTPRGLHEIRAKIGAGAPLGTVFVGRRPTGEICTPERLLAEPNRDWILTRILWLRGLERGRNRGRGCDSMRRFIYIHGTPHESAIGTPASHGCVRMTNADVVELFDAIPPGTLVEIE
jgi:L,D-transpeptidase YbiS